MLNLKVEYPATNCRKEESATVPNQSLTVREVMRRFASGIPAQSVAQAFYDEETELSDQALKKSLESFDESDGITDEQGSDIVDVEAAAKRYSASRQKVSKDSIKAKSTQEVKESEL